MIKEGKLRMENSGSRTTVSLMKTRNKDTSDEDEF